MKRKMLITASLISLAMIGSIEGGIDSFAQGPGEATTTMSTETTNVNINTYYQDSVRNMGAWVQDGDWKFKLLAGGYLTRSWIESLTEPGAFYYVNDYGVMGVSVTTPDGYTVDSTGLYRRGVTNPNTSSHPSPNETQGSNESVERYPNGAPKTIRGVPVNERGVDKDGNYMMSDELLKWMESQTWSTGNYGGIN